MGGIARAHALGKHPREGAAVHEPHGGAAHQEAVDVAQAGQGLAVDGGNRPCTVDGFELSETQTSCSHNAPP